MIPGVQTSIRPQSQEPAPLAGGATPPTNVKSQPLPILLLKAMRPKQWSKNVLLFAALVFALEFTHPNSILRAFIGFLLFCLFSSCVYIINDLRDREKDKLNQRTASRPIASGALKPQVALTFVSVLLPLTFI